MEGMTVKQVAHYLERSGRLKDAPRYTTVYKWIHRPTNPLPAKKCKGKGMKGKGGQWRIKQSDLDAWPLPSLGRPPKGER